MGLFSQGYLILRRGVFVRAGELLAAIPKNVGAKGSVVPNVDRAKSKDKNHSLASLGISKNESSLWQQLAKIPEPEFEQRLAITSRRPIK